MKENYGEYRFSVREVLKYLVQCLVICGILDYLFYQNQWLMILSIPISVIWLKIRKKQLIRERKKNLNY